jgi:hypothetical protein
MSKPWMKLAALVAALAAVPSLMTPQIAEAGCSPTAARTLSVITDL